MLSPGVVHASLGVVVTCALLLATPSYAQANKPAVTSNAPAKKPQVKVAALSEWEEAVNAFKYQDFDNAIPKLRKLIYPKPRLGRKREWRAREYLAAALWWSGKKPLALDEFTALLVRNPQSRLDPAYYPPQMIKDFAQQRANLIRLGVIKRNQKARPGKQVSHAAPPALALSLFPFGVGQFANRETVKGIAFLTTEVALAATSTALYAYNRDLGVQGKKSDSAQVWQLSTGTIFWAVAAWGVVDAVLGRRAIAAEIVRAARRGHP
ncbi:MAG: hypothetical protein KC502_18495 [Myxococcales bacterium]|nr:hypothetical protein [Myxococcales bacterium]